MKHWNRAILSAFLVVLSVGAYCQESNLVAKCLGQAWSAYAKAFGNAPTWKKGGATVNEYKTGSAKIEVIQSVHHGIQLDASFQCPLLSLRHRNVRHIDACNLPALLREPPC